jgi:hypothetical protein
MSEPAVACSLNASERARRLKAGADLSRRALLETESVPRGLRLRFSYQPGIRAELEELIEAESECCPFLGFELDSTGKELILAVRGPEEAQAVIEDLFGLDPGSRR